MNRLPTLHVLTPTYKPVGGVVKIMDYVTHARAAGRAVSVWCPQEWDESLPLFEIERFRSLVEDPAVSFHSDDRLVVRRRDLVFLSLPANYEVAYRSLPAGMSPERVVHIIQNVRHVNASWGKGYPLRLLTRPLARISINDIVADVVRPWLDPRALHEVIPLGHDLAFFARRREGGLQRPVRVAYTTWKSDVGHEVRDLLAGDDRFTFKAVEKTVGWSKLRDLYHRSDVFLATPNPEEGLYLPGLEAMAAGCLVVTPDVGGNMAYSRPDENCLLVDHGSAAGYAAALETLSRWSDAQVEAFRAAGYAATEPFDLDEERRRFAAFLTTLWRRIEAVESGAGLPEVEGER